MSNPSAPNLSRSLRSGSSRAATRILIVDDHELVRQGLRLLIERDPELDVCGEASDEVTALRLVRELRPEIVVVDLSLHEGDGLALVKSIVKQHPESQTIIATMHSERVYGERALRAGARGFVSKHDPAVTILDAIRRVRLGKLYFSEELTARVMRRTMAGNADVPDSPVETLSDRELDVFRLIGGGLATIEIANRLHLSRSTVDTYRDRIKSKLGLRTAAELTYRAIQWCEQES